MAKANTEKQQMASTITTQASSVQHVETYAPSQHPPAGSATPLLARFVREKGGCLNRLTNNAATVLQASVSGTARG